MNLEAAQGRPPWSRGAHTPGPWELDATWGLIKHGKSEICAIHSGNLANARLIAAAPHLLAILNEVCMQHDMGLNKIETSLYDIAKTALRKAKGETT
jgi:hypothetical protein